MEICGKPYLQANEINAVAAGIVERSCHSAMSEDAPMCWICLDSGGDLMFPCKCPRAAHRKCLARWQLQSAGTRKELFCEFCDAQLPDWKQALTPTSGANAPAVMNVNFDGRTYSFEVKPGPEGYRMFTEAIRRAFNLPEDSELNITFTCDEPTVPEAGSLLTLQGPGAYDAAVHCASVSAARRMTTPTSSRPMSPVGGLEGFSVTPTSPHSPHLGLASVPSYHTPSPLDAAAVPNRTPGSMSGASIDDSEAEASGVGNKRRLSGFGRKLRIALTDLLSVRS